MQSIISIDNKHPQGIKTFKVVFVYIIATQEEKSGNEI